MSDSALPHSPASERNKQPIWEVLRPLLPASGNILEIASGTGQHVVHFAAAAPALQWWPSDPDASSCRVVDQRVRALSLPNVAAALVLDVHEAAWPLPGKPALMVCINMIHIAPWSATQALFSGAARHLDPQGAGRLLLYGPYREAGQHTCDSNEQFDRSLRERNPLWGVRDLDQVRDVAVMQGFTLGAVTRMPANNPVRLLGATAGLSSQRPSRRRPPAARSKTLCRW